MLEMGVDRAGASSVGPEGQGAVLVEESQGRVRLHADHGVGGGRNDKEALGVGSRFPQEKVRWEGNS